MKKKSRYRFFIWSVIISGFILVITLTITSIKVIREGKNFTEKILEENRVFLTSAIGFGHGVMVHMGSENYEKLIDLALELKSIKYIGIIDKNGK